MKLDKAISGFLLFKEGEGLSPTTIKTYELRLRQWREWVGDVELERIDALSIVQYLDYMRNEYRPQRLSGKTHPISSSTLRNIWVALRSFWTWVEEVLDLSSPMTKVKAPKTERKETIPFNEKEVRALLAEVQPERAKKPRSGKRYEQHLRDRAIILLLLDTGLRSSELCSLTIGDLYLKTGKISVAGKGAKHRYVWAASVTRQALWQYLSECSDGDNPDRPLFVSTQRRRALHRRWLHRRLKQIGEAAGVDNVYPHRFRHTFAIQYLRNEGDVFTLQILLGHSSLKMVRYYARLADVDTERVHTKASPVDSWLK